MTGHIKSLTCWAAFCVAGLMPDFGYGETIRAHDLQGEDTETICSAKGKLEDDDLKAVHAPRPELATALDWISEMVSIAPNFELYGGDFRRSPVAFALRRGKQRYIVYDRAFFSKKSGELTWFDIGVLAHEIGHHINGHTSGYNKTD